MSLTIFSNQAGRVVAFADPALPGVASVRLTGFGGFTSMRSIITRVGFSGQANAQFRHTIGGAVHLYTFGDRIGSATVSGLCFDQSCDGGFGDGLSAIVGYYNMNRVSARPLPLALTIGAAISLRTYLVMIAADVADTKTRVYQFTLNLVLVPTPARAVLSGGAARAADAAADRSFANAGAAGGGGGGEVAEPSIASGTTNTLPSMTAGSSPDWDQGGAPTTKVTIAYPPTPGWASPGAGPNTALTRGFG